MSIDRWMDKENVVYKYNGILLSSKKNEIMPFIATWMDLEMIMLSEVSQRKKISYEITNMCLKNDRKELLKWKQTQRFWNQTYSYQRWNVRRGSNKLGGCNWHIYTTIYIKYIGNEDLLCSTGKIYSILSNNLYGKSIWKGMDICICIPYLLCHTPETNTTLQVNYTPVNFFFFGLFYSCSI